MIQTYKCPNCGGQMNFDAAENILKCDHCGHTATVEEAAESDPALGTRAADEGIDTDGDQIREYSCPACGAKLVTDTETGATVCAFCGTGTLLPSRLSGDFRPSRIIPFKVEKKEAQKKLREWSASFKLTPSGFQSAAIMDKLTGVYVPYWLYSATATGEVSGEGRIIHKQRTPNEEITTTEHYRVERTVRNDYKGVPVDASEKMPDDAMGGLEPYNYDDLQIFRLPYLSGFQAEKYNNPAEHYEEIAWNAIEKDIVSNARETIRGYDETSISHSRASLEKKRWEYVMLPVWSLAFKYGGKAYPVYVNGQTGKIDGILPLSKSKLALLSGIFFAAFFILALVLGLTGRVELFTAWYSWPILGLIGGGLAALIAKGRHNKHSYTPRRHYTDGEAELLNREDRYIRTVTTRREIKKEK